MEIQDSTPPLKSRTRTPKLPPLSPAELARFRANPDEERDRGIENYIACRECGVCLKRLGNGPRQHLPSDGLNTKQYRRKWPGAPISCLALKKTAAVYQRNIRAKHPRQRISGFQRSTHSRNAALAAWEHRPRVSGNELALFRADPRREDKLRIKNYVICRECGVYVTRLDRASSHLRRFEKMTTQQYKTKWPGAPMRSLKVKKKQPKTYKRWYSKNAAEVKKNRAAKRRADLAKLAAAERIIAQQKPKRKRGPKEQPEETKTYYLIGIQVELRIPAALKRDRHAIVDARRFVAANRKMNVDVVAQYHKKYRAFCKKTGTEFPA